MEYQNLINIFYRHVHIKHDARSRDPNKQRPQWFSHEKCFENLIKTIDSSTYKNLINLTIIYDGTIDEYNNDFISHYCKVPRIYPIQVKIVAAGSNMKSWRVALEQAIQAPIDDNSFLYFLENDYLHTFDWIEKFTELANSNHIFDYLSLYDHKDKYFFPMYDDLKSRLIITENHHWRTTPSTCGTFLVKKRTLIEDIDIWYSEIQDHYAFTELIENRKRILLSPLPGLSTHCMAGYLSPTVKWEEL